MKTLNIYLQESLLDDLDGLENKSDIIIKRQNTIGAKYKVILIEDRDIKLDHINKTELKKYPLLWDQDWCSASNKYGLKYITDEYVLMLVNTLLSFNIKSLALGEYLKSNEIFKYFNSLFKNNIVEVNGHIRKFQGETEIKLDIISKDKWGITIWLEPKK
jgi:hypothetical protein